ncbi:MAG: esterase, partial [Chitinophagaceae bacterium]
SLWWRKKSYEDGYDNEQDRIMHQLIRKGRASKSLKFFFQCGLLDETADRNKNGIIDSVEDTLDLIQELKAKGYSHSQIAYHEMHDGKHDVPTWARAMPHFLKWGWSY